MADSTYGMLIVPLNPQRAIPGAVSGRGPNICFATQSPLGVQRIPWNGVASGNGKLIGQVVVHGIGYDKCLVQVAATAVPTTCLAALETDPQGNFLLLGVDMTKKYIVTAFDRTGTWNVRGWSFITPVLM
jgi:hypothetical protein